MLLRHRKLGRFGASKRPDVPRETDAIQSVAGTGAPIVPLILKILILFVVVIVAVLVFAATKPDTFRVQRSITIHARQEKIFPLINDLHAWDSWSPQDRKDAAAATTFSGPASGQGATAAWDAQGRAGKGRMEISGSEPASKVEVRVDFVRPFEAHNINTFELTPAGEGATVTWSIQASNRYPMKLAGVFFNIPREFEKHVDEGLRNLKTIAEK
jgi:hypothetical protein